MTQYLYLDVVSGPLSGQTYPVPAHGTLLVGRQAECGLSIPQDLTVSRQQCRIEFHPPVCRVVHLSQTSPTTVNDVSVATAELRTGDQISFGADNTLRIRFDETGSGIASAATGDVERFTVSSTTCDWSVYQSPSEQPGFERMLQVLGRTNSVHAVIDFRRMGQTPPADLVNPQHLYGWMPPEKQTLFSPMLLSLAECPQFTEIVRTGWGRDGIVCFGSELSGVELLAHWRKAIGMDGDRPGTALTAFFWPSLLSLMLTCQSSQQLSPLLSGLSWVVLESMESPGQWKLFAHAEFATVLTTFGLIPAESATVKMN